MLIINAVILNIICISLFSMTRPFYKATSYHFSVCLLIRLLSLSYLTSHSLYYKSQDLNSHYLWFSSWPNKITVVKGFISVKDFADSCTVLLVTQYTENYENISTSYAWYRLRVHTIGSCVIICSELFKRNRNKVNCVIWKRTLDDLICRSTLRTQVFY